MTEVQDVTRRSLKRNLDSQLSLKLKSYPNVISLFDIYSSIKFIAVSF